MIGQTLAHYEILASLGKGGMGEVYRARDTKLDRDVAVKVLPREMSEDPERIARFEREARVLASLQHPNIAAIHGFENLPNARFLVMELVEGEDLADRMARGLGVRESVEIAAEIAQGLEAAHAQGIVHRDLKPTNVRITAEGAVKILDFGLARAYVGDSGSESDLEHSPTITAAMTQAGTILGTAAYMSPEQARGRYVDQRTDLWSLGVILLEMLTGRQVFQEDTISDTLAAVLRADLDFSDLPDDVPANVVRVLRRCLERDPRRRMRSAGDVWLDLTDTDTTPVASAPSSSRRWLVATLILLAASIGLAARGLRTSAPSDSRAPTHLAIPLPVGAQFASRDQMPLGVPQPNLDISRDGRLIVASVEYQGDIWLYRRFLDRPQGEIVPGTQGAYHPRISPDGTRIAFLADNQVKRIDAGGERVTPLIPATNPFGLAWRDDQQLVLSLREGTQLVEVDVQRNTSTPLLASDGLIRRFFWPEPVPDQDATLVNHGNVARGEETEVDPISFISHGDPEPRMLAIEGTMPRFLRPDFLTFVRDGALMGTTISPDGTADAVPTTLLEDFVVESTVGQVAVSPVGTVAYVEGSWLVGKSLTWDDGRGGIQDLGFPSLGYGDFELSPDGTKLAVTIGSANASIWVYDLERGTRRVCASGIRCYNATWSPDGTRIAFSLRLEDGFALAVQTVGASPPAEILRTSEYNMAPYVWHEDAGIVFAEWRGSGDLYQLDPSNPGEITTLVDSDASEWGPDLSPDGNWLAYTSDESGRYEIYVRSLRGRRSWPVSVDGGEEPIWSSDGQALFFRNGTRFMRAEVIEASGDGSRFRAAVPTVHVEGAYANVPGVSFDVGPDDQSLLLLRTDGGSERPSHINVILDADWIDAQAR